MSTEANRKPTAAEHDNLVRIKNRLIDCIEGELNSGQISDQGMLALIANITGMLIATTDQKELTPTQAINLTMNNIKAGHAFAMEQRVAGVQPTHDGGKGRA